MSNLLLTFQSSKWGSIRSYFKLPFCFFTSLLTIIPEIVSVIIGLLIVPGRGLGLSPKLFREQTFVLCSMGPSGLKKICTQFAHISPFYSLDRFSFNQGFKLNPLCDDCNNFCLYVKLKVHILNQIRTSKTYFHILS